MLQASSCTCFKHEASSTGLKHQASSIKHQAPSSLLIPRVLCVAFVACVEGVWLRVVACRCACGKSRYQGQSCKNCRTSGRTTRSRLWAQPSLSSACPSSSSSSRCAPPQCLHPSSRNDTWHMPECGMAQCRHSSLTCRNADTPPCAMAPTFLNVVMAHSAMSPCPAQTPLRSY